MGMDRPRRPQDEHTDAAHLLKPNVAVRIKLVADGRRVAFYRNDEWLFALDDPAPCRDGWFGFRTVASRIEIRDLRISRPAS